MDEAPLVEDKPQLAAAAAAFKRMTDRIILNKDAAFGGAVVVYPPENGGEPVDMLMFAEQSPAAFWSLLKVMIDQRIADLDRGQGRPYGR